MTLYQFPTIDRLRALGFQTVAGPFTNNSPVGGAVVMMDEGQNIVRVVGDGSVEVPTGWQTDTSYDDGPTCGLEGCP